MSGAAGEISISGYRPGALGFWGVCGYPRVHLWTFAGLDAARRLYDDAGFQAVEEQDDDQWGKTMREQRMVLRL